MAKPALNADGTLTACVVTPAYGLGSAQLITLELPTAVEPLNVGGRYFLVRCGAQSELERAEQWSIYLRRALFVAAASHALRTKTQTDGSEVEEKWGRWELLLGDPADPGQQWLAQLPVGATINLLGPLGQGYPLPARTRNLLLLTDEAHAPLLLPLIEPVLNRGGRVTLLLDGATPPTDLLARLPIPVEVRLAATPAEWQHHLQETVRWADQLCAALPNPQYPALAETIRRLRFRLEPGFAQVLVQADLLCGVGACLACVIPLPDGSHTRACVHGPVFDLKGLV